MDLQTSINQRFKLEEERKVSVTFENEKGILICTTTGPFLNYGEFTRIFGKIGDMVQHYPVKKFIFDKRSLTVFDQPSMEWYHVHWKREMLKHGLKTYRKILPDNFVFQKSVEIGRGKISQNNPDFRFEDFDIQYCKTIEEAIEL